MSSCTTGISKNATLGRTGSSGRTRCTGGFSRSERAVEYGRGWLVKVFPKNSMIKKFHTTLPVELDGVGTYPPAPSLFFRDDPLHRFMSQQLLSECRPLRQGRKYGDFYEFMARMIGVSVIVIAFVLWLLWVSGN